MKRFVKERKLNDRERQKVNRLKKKERQKEERL